MIIVEPLGGLANRMRVIASAIALNEKINTSLVVVWNINDELYCPYEALFEKSQAFSVESKKRKYSYLKASRPPGRFKSFIADIVNRVIGIGYFADYHTFSDPASNAHLDLPALAKRHGNLYIRTWSEFAGTKKCYQYLTPVYPIRQKIREVTGRFNSPVVGVHIRRTDHENARRYSPDQLFIGKMKQELANNHRTRFFLCTDDPIVEELIIKRFGDKVITYPKQYGRITVKGMQDAVIELFCLSKTDRILGSYWSSFSEVASLLNEAELETLQLA